jgi:hypothetical protein
MCVRHVRPVSIVYGLVLLMSNQPVHHYMLQTRFGGVMRFSSAATSR